MIQLRVVMLLWCRFDHSSITTSFNQFLVIIFPLMLMTWAWMIQWIFIIELWCLFDFSVVINSFSSLKLWTKRIFLFDFFLLRLQEDHMSIADLFIFLKFSPLLTLITTYWMKLDQDLTFSCILAQFSELKWYCPESSSIRPHLKLIVT